VFTSTAYCKRLYLSFFEVLCKEWGIQNSFLSQYSELESRILNSILIFGFQQCSKNRQYIRFKLKFPATCSSRVVDTLQKIMLLVRSQNYAFFAEKPHPNPTAGIICKCISKITSLIMLVSFLWRTCPLTATQVVLTASNWDRILFFYVLPVSVTHVMSDVVFVSFSLHVSVLSIWWKSAPDRTLKFLSGR